MSIGDRFQARKKQKGFTLIELLVVISIIGVISGLIMVGMQSARMSARDAVRKRDMQMLENALVMYWDKTGQFPAEAGFDGSIGSDGCDCPSVGGPEGCTGDNWCSTSAIWSGIVVQQKILGKLPVDPSNNPSYYYFYEPCCEQDCGGGRSCVGKGCCEFTIGASKLEGSGQSFPLGKVGAIAK
jgi:prepilin-type N-terminal cleavage/methylation domain-containing protein